MKSISNEKEYNAILKRIDELLEFVTDENYSTLPEGIELDFLSSLVEEYENRHYPIEQPSMADVMKLRNISASIVLGV